MKLDNCATRAEDKNSVFRMVCFLLLISAQLLMVPSCSNSMPAREISTVEQALLGHWITKGPILPGTQIYIREKLMISFDPRGEKNGEVFYQVIEKNEQGSTLTLRIHGSPPVVELCTFTNSERTAIHAQVITPTNIVPQTNIWEYVDASQTP